MDPPVFLQQQFARFYSSHPLSVESVEWREFGTGEWKQKISSRHMAFGSQEEFNRFLAERAPLYVSASAAYYEHPSAKPMEAKQWVKGDLVYEFDADDLKPECFLDHTFWSCPHCQTKGKGAPDYCSSCGERVQVEEWTCPECLKATRRELFRLLDVLEQELGMREGFSFNFSGNKGYHVHVRSPTWQFLSPKARVELVDYLSGSGLEWPKLGFEARSGGFRLPSGPQSGWSRRTYDYLNSLLAEGDYAKIAALGGVREADAKKLLNDPSKVLVALSEGFVPSGLGKKNEAFWMKLLSAALECNRIRLDRSTSIDSSKLIRVPNSLHGETGLAARVLSREQLKEFEPLHEAVVFGPDSVRLEGVRAPKFFLGGEFFGPFADESAELPLFAAVYLLGRGNAHGIVV
ncbi:MAG: hypothetical protein HY917_04370 [Candidatus Diapherotrites archaeon]|nr:hypothetical protein [Candidatus Diapherotrites archaeon]